MMTWEKRARDVLLAGGALAVSACASSATPCGNANSDPCICGRPGTNAQTAALCDDKKACEARGGSFDYPISVDDGGQAGWACLMDSGAPVDESSDAAADAADGSAVDAADASVADAGQAYANDAGTGGG